jgi:uncharacterized protein
MMATSQSLAGKLASVFLSEGWNEDTFEQIVRDGTCSPAELELVVRGAALQVNSAMFPPVTDLELIHTEGCNLGCSYCFEREMLGFRRMPPDVAKAAIDLLIAYSGKSPTVRITHFGGEPLMNFEAIQVATEYAIEEAAKAGKTVDFDMTSNGTLFTDQYLTYCRSRKIKILLSIDGLKASNDRYRLDKRGRGTFDRVVKGLALLRQYQDWIGVKMTVMPANAASLLTDVIGLRALGVNQFIIGHATGVEWQPGKMAEFGRSLRQVADWYKQHRGPDLRIGEFEEPVDQTPRFGCQAGRSSIAVAVDGTISPCSKILGLGVKQPLLKLGNVRFGITGVATRLELNHCQTLKSNCASAGISQMFSGGCFAANHSDTGSVFVPSLTDHEMSLISRSVCAGCTAH